MAIKSWRYVLTLKNVLNRIETLRKEGRPLFRIQKRLNWNKKRDLKMSDPKNTRQCPIMNFKTFDDCLNGCFDNGVAFSACKPMTQGMMVFFLLGGYLRFTDASPSNLSYLFSGSTRAAGDLGDSAMFAADLIRWKGFPKVDGNWEFVDTMPDSIPSEAVTLTEYIVRINETIIKRYCSPGSQEDLRQFLRDVAINICSVEKSVPENTAPMNFGYVEMLARHLDMLTRLAKASSGEGMQPRYLAEGLTWLMTASLLRGRFPADREEFYSAVKKAHKAAEEMGIIKTEEMGQGKKPVTDGIHFERNATKRLMGNVWNIVSPNSTTTEMTILGSIDEDADLRDYLAEVFKQKRSSHPSFQLLAADEIDSRLYPNIKEYRQIEPRGKAPSDSDCNNGNICPVQEIIRGTWPETEHRSVVILGEGGIGKTVTLFSIASPPNGTLCVPSLYIPMYELVDKDGHLLELNEYISKRYRRYGDRIDTLATQTWNVCPRLLILLDGFNEIPFSLRRRALDVINEWHDSHPGAQVVAVSRPMDGLDLTQELAGNPVPIMLSPLDENTILEYLKEIGRRIPPRESPIWEYLRYPLFLNLYVRTGRLMGKSPAGYPLRVMNADNGGALIWNFLQRELLRHKADKTEKAENWVLRCAVANEYILPYLAHRMVIGQRMKISFDEAVSWTKEAMSQFDGNSLPQHLNAVWGTYRRRHGSIPGKELYQSDVWRDTVLRDSGILIPLAEQNNAVEVMNDNYVFMHQQFRDCLAGLYLVNQAETARDGELPEVWRHSQNHQELNYAAELMDEDTADRLWKINRTSQQYNSPGYKKDHSGTIALLELQKRRKPRPENLDFSGMDLRGFSLARYMSNGKDSLPLFQKANLTINTKLDQSTFQSEGHTSHINCILTLPDGRIVSGSSDDTLRVWDSSTGQCLQILEGHKGMINCVAVLPDGRIVSGSSDDTLRVWDSSTGQCLQILEGHKGTIYYVAVLPDGRIVSGSSDNSLRVWDSSTGQCIRTLEGHSEISCLAILPDGRVVSGSWDGTLRVWNSSTGQCLQILEGHKGRINCVVVLSDGRIVSSSSDHSLRVWDSSTGQCLQTLEGHSGGISCVAVLPGGCVVSGSYDNSLRVWDSSTGQCLQILKGHTRHIICMAVLPDGRIVSSSSDHSLRVWDSSTGQCLQTLEGHSGGISCVAVLPDGHVVSGSYDKSLRVWDSSTGQCIRTLEGHNKGIECLAILPDGRIISGLEDNSLRLWDSSTAHCLQIMKNNYIVVALKRCIAILPDDRIVISSYDSSIQIWDPSTGQCLQILKGHRGMITCVAVLPDGRVVSGSYDNSLRVWDSSTGQCLQILKGHTRHIICMAVLPDGRIVSGSSDKTLRVWDPTTGQCLQILEGHRGTIDCVAILPDGRIVSGSWDDTLRVWNPLTAQCIQVLEGHSSCVDSVAVLPDGRIVSGSWDGTLRVWNSSTGQCIHTLRRNPDFDNNSTIISTANYILVLPDGRIVSDSYLYSDGRIVSDSYLYSGGSLKVWDPTTGQCLQTLDGHTSFICCVSAFPDGRVISGSSDGIIKLWNPNTGKCIKTIEITDTDVSQMDLSSAILTDDLAKLLWQNGAKVFNAVSFQHSPS